MSNMRRTTRRILSALSAAGLTMSLATVASAVVVSTTTAPAAAKDDGLALTPPMGFNNWNDTGCGSGFNENYVKSMADLMVSTGLKDAGYEYLNLDDCWARPQISPLGSRDADGHLVPDPVRFPNGIASVADYVHGKGLKFGIYSDRGTRTCNGQGFDGGLGAGWQPGDPTFEEIDAQDFADWGVDYLKFDNCNNQGLNAQERYTIMRDALEATGRDIVFSICEWGQNDPWLWGADVGHLWRTTGDISANYSSMSNIAKRNLALAQYAGPGHWNDPDMLQVGNGSWSLTEQRTHFSLWSIMAAPLLIGTDLRDATQQTMDILLNKEAIAVDQDPLGVQGDLVGPVSDGQYVIAKPLEDGDVAVALWNDTTSAARISTTASEVGLPRAAAYTMRDLWDHSEASTARQISAWVPAHGTAFYRVHPGAPDDAPPSTQLSLDLDRRIFTGGDQGNVTATLTNSGRIAIEDASLSVEAPDGWTAEPASKTAIGAVPPGRSATVHWVLSAPEGAAPGEHPVSVRADYVYGDDSLPASAESATSVRVPPPLQDFSDSFDNVGVSNDDNTNAANLDGGGSSMSAQALAAAGVTPGATITHGGVSFTWPDAAAGQPDNVVASGEAFHVSGSGTTLGLLATSTYGTANGTGAVLYTDGSASEFTLSVPDWYSAPPASADIAISTPYRNRPNNTQQQRASGINVFFVGVPLDPAKTVRGVMLPDVSPEAASGQTSLHVFALGVG